MQYVVEGCLRMSGSDGAGFLTESAPTAPTSQFAEGKVQTNSK